MKLTTLLLIIALVQASAKGYSQVTLREKNAPYEKVLKSIEKQTGYFFVYNDQQIKLKNISVVLTNVSIEQALKACFDGAPVTYQIIDKNIVLQPKEPSFFDKIKSVLQVPVKVSGKVTDTTGTPLPGATIISKTSGKAVFTDDKGEFMLTTQSGDQLTISFIGFQPYTITVKDGLAFQNVVLHTSFNKLNEIIVTTGYQQLPKERATGSFNVIDNKKFNEQVSTSILSRLPAIANGLIADNSTYGGDGRLIIRGLSTIQGPKSPLVVLDNFPYEGDINNINPNDVESITLLKDAAASSIWGARAGNGVIVITTKKGSFNKPMSINFTGNTTVGTKPDLGYLRQMSSSDFIDVEEMLYKKGFYASRISNAGRPPLTPVVEMLIKYNGDTSNPNYKAFTDPLRSFDVRDQYSKYFYQKAVNQQYALNLNGGSQTNAWIASAGYDNNSGTLDDNYRRLNLHFGNTFQLAKDLRISSDIYYTQNQNISGKPAYGSITSSTYDLYPYARFATESGVPVALAQKRQPYIDTAGAGRLQDWRYYPLEDYKHHQNTNKAGDMLINTGVNYTFLKGLSADLKYQYERQQTNGRNYWDQDSYYARNLVNTYSQINSSTGVVNYKVPKGGVLDFSNSLLESQDIRGQLNFNRTWNKHELNMIGGGEIRSAHNTSDSYRDYGYNDNISTFGYVDYTNTYPEYIGGTLSYIPSNNSLDDMTTRFVSAYANAAYTYNSKYTLSASARRDASNLFGLNTNNRWNLLWSAGGGWDVSRESFYQSTLIPYLRLRTTYGFSGNIDPSMSAVSTIRYVGSSTYTPGAVYAQFNNYANPDLTWETSGMLNIGLDFRFASNRLGGSIEYYRKNGYNLFGNAQIDQTAGVGASITKNVAKMKTTGIDVELNSVNIKSRSFTWTTDLNFNYNKDEVTDYYLSTQQASNFAGTRNLSGIIGKPVYSVLSYKWAGLDPQTGDPRGYLNGQISSDYSKLMYSATLNDLDYNGPLLPVFFGSAGNTFTLYNVSLTVRLTYKLGNYFRRNSINYSNLFNSGTGHSDYALRWQQTGDEQHTNVPSLVYPYNSNRDAFYAGSSALVEKADNIRLQYINLSYDLGEKLTDKLGIKKLSLFLNASNLGIIWRANKLGLDPEYQDGIALPPSKTISIGLRAAIN